MYDEENENNQEVEQEQADYKSSSIPLIAGSIFLLLICAGIHWATINPKNETALSISFSFLYLFLIVFVSAAFGIVGSIVAGVLSLAFFIGIVIIKSGTPTNYLIQIIIIFLFSLTSGGVFQFFKSQFMKQLEKAEEDFNTLLGKHRALTISNDRMKAEDMKVAKLASRLVAIQTITKLLGNTMNPKVIMKEILKTTKKIFGASRCSVLVTDPDKNILELKDQLGWNKEETENLKIPLGKGIPGYVAQKGEMITVNEIKENYRFQELAKDPTIKSIMCAPLKKADKTMGVLNIGGFVEEHTPSSEESRLLDFLGILSGMAMNNAEMHSEIKRFAEIDALTQMYNNRYFQDFLDSEIKRVNETGAVVSIFMSDIDHFKNFNDTYGHQIGDFVLRENAGVMMSSVREDDLVARYGGEEFIAVLPNTDTKKAYELAEKYRKNVENSIYHEGGHTLKVTVSIGVATYPIHAKDKDSLIKMADDGLYFAKEGGRNMTIITADAKKKEAQAKATKKLAPKPAVSKPVAKEAVLTKKAPAQTKTISKKVGVKPKTKTVSRVIRWKLIKKIIKQPDGTQKIVQSKVRIED